MSNTRELMAEIVFRGRAGPRYVWRWLADRLTDERSDRAFGILSSARGQEEAAPAAPEHVRYQAVSYRDMREILGGITLAESDVFLDFGSGLGRAVCLAATHPFRAVIGVEISAGLCERARMNVERVAHKLQCRDVRIVEADAAEYPIPREVTVFFFFNPFSGSVLRKVLAKVTRSFAEAPRSIEVIFYGTVSTERFRGEAEQHSALRLTADLILETGARALIYEMRPFRAD